MSTESRKVPQLVIFDWEGTLGQHGCELLPGVRETLDILRAHSIDIAVATSMSTARLKELVAEFELSDYFVHLQTSQMGYPKPDPDMLHEILTATNHTLEQAVMVGDSTYDLEMANFAGMAMIGVLTGCDGRDQLTEISSTAVILESVTELPAYYQLG